jgi:4-alpha-glucanotransferase
MIRIDHFRGFEAFWEIPGHEPTAINGTWVPAPAMRCSRAWSRSSARLPLVAEDLGVITEGSTRCAASTACRA